MISFKTLSSDRKIVKAGFLARAFASTPVISVIMPTCCRGQTSLRRAVDSVLKQTFSNFEFIIVDDGSRDGTFEILQKYRQKDARITIIRHEDNSGLPAARVNEAILLAKGKYIAYQFDDDEWLPDFLETLYGEMLKQNEPCAVYGTCSAQIKLQDGKVVHTSLGRAFDYALLQSDNFIANNSILHPKEVFEHCGMFDPHVIVRRLSDYDLWLRMARKMKFVWVDKTVSRVYKGEKHSFAEADGIVLKHDGKLRKYMEIGREELLVPSRIETYEVDDLTPYHPGFTQEEIDYLNRHEIIPFRNRTTYYLSEEQIHTGNISRPRIRRLGLSKGAYSTSIDVTIKNYTNRIENFPYRYYFVSENNESTLGKDDFDLFGFYKTIGNSSTDYLHTLKAAGKPSLYFMDDNMFKFHELGEQFDYLKPGTPGFINLEKQVAGCDLIVSYSPVITEDCKKYNSKVVQCQTNIPGKYLIYKKKGRSKIIKFAILTGPSRTKEMSSLFPVLEQFSKKYKNKIEFHFWGINPDDFGKLHCKTFYEEFTNSYDQYLDRLKQSDFDFTLCPLEGILDATKSKSPIKLLEGTAAGSVLICSDVMPYSELPNDVCIKTGNSREEWLNALTRAAGMKPNEKSAIYDKAYNYVRSHYTSEVQANRFLGVLEAAELQHKLGGAKIAYFFRESYLGGATLHLLKHAQYMKEFGFEVLLCLPESQRFIPDLNEKITGLGLPLYYLPYVSSIKVENDPCTPEFSAFIVNWLRSNNVGLAHSVTYIEAVGTACQALHIPHVATLHQYYGSRLTQEQIRKSKLIDYVHSSSNKYAYEWSNCLEVPSRKICCAVEQEYFDCFETNRRRFRTKPKAIRILLSGTVQPRKNQLEAIKAVKLLKDRGYTLNLILVGYKQLLEDYVKLCESCIQDNGLHDEIELAGFEPNPLKYYNNYSDLLLCCSLDESMPQTILQAMAAGVPVVTAEVGGVREIIKNNYNGILFEGTDAASIANGLEAAIAAIWNDSGSMLDNAHHCARMVAHPDFVKSELIDLYNEVFL